MNRLTILGVIAGLGVLAACIGAQQPAEFTVDRLDANLAVIKDADDGNTAVLIRAGGVVLVDTKSMRAGRRLLDALRTITDKPVTHILHTHHHYDHVGGNALFPGNVEVIAHENAAARMPAMAEFNTPERRTGLPDRTFKDTLTLFSGADAIELYHFGPAHTDNDAFIVFRGLGVMHSGDTFPDVAPQEQHGGSATRYPDTLGQAAALTGIRTVIPGHGPVKSWKDFTDYAASLRK